eukprot:3386987-Amphidinium_carterae.1
MPLIRRYGACGERSGTFDLNNCGALSHPVLCWEHTVSSAIGNPKLEHAGYNCIMSAAASLPQIPDLTRGFQRQRYKSEPA